jgi:hypothetical protein
MGHPNDALISVVLAGIAFRCERYGFVPISEDVEYYDGELGVISAAFIEAAWQQAQALPGMADVMGMPEIAAAMGDPEFVAALRYAIADDALINS